MNEDCVKCLPKTGQILSKEEIPLMTQYIPYRLVRSIGELPCCFFERRLERLEGYSVYFDIIGFTSLVAQHVNSGKDVAQLSDIFRSYYSLVVDTVKMMGGSVFQFAGDSLLMCFEKLYGEDPQSNWRRTLYAMKLAIERSDAWNQENSLNNGFSLRPKIGIGYGVFYQILLGDQSCSFAPIIAGEAVNEAIAAERVCQGGGIMLGPAAFTQAEDDGLASSFQAEDGFYRLRDLPPQFGEDITPPGFCDESILYENPRYYYRVNAFINPLIRQQIKSRFQGFIGEYREITCLMARFDGPFSQTQNEFTLVEGYQNLNTLYKMIHDKAARFGGFCPKPDISDKGTVFPIFFGAPVALENKERNAILCAEELLRLRIDLDFLDSVSIGIATGNVYAGEFGGVTRKDFTVVGSCINFAARLMMIQEKDCLFTDDATRKKVDKLCSFDSCDGITLKGFATEQSVFRFCGFIDERKSGAKRIGMVGRKDELDILHKDAELFLSGQKVCRPIVGDAGMGKSFLVETFLADIFAVHPEIRLINGSCYQYEESTIFFPWRAVISEVLGVTEDQSSAEAVETLTNLFPLKFGSDNTVWLPFFLNMLGYEVSESASTQELDLTVKQDRFFSLAYQVIADAAREKPVILLIEDIHWSDAVSLQLLEYIINVRDTIPLLILPVSRESDEITGFFNNLRVPVLHLGQLKTEDARELAAVLLNMEETDEKLVEKILVTSDCNPFFIENIVQNMIESGILAESSEGTFFLSKDIRNINIPSSIQNIILARLNTLLFEEQVVFKTASVIGRTFFADILRALVPDGISEYIFHQALESFESHNLILREDERRAAYYFKHISIRDVVYNTILESTRKELNRLLMSYLEDRYADNLLSVVERLAYHAGEADDSQMLYKYALLSAQKSERQFATADAIVHYQNALLALSKLDIPEKEHLMNDTSLALARVYRRNNNYEQAMGLYTRLLQTEKRPMYRAAILQGTGQCFQEQGKFDQAVAILEAALTALGEKAPKSVPATIFSILFEVIRQGIKTGILRNHIREYSGKRRQIAEMRTDILFVLTKLYYFGKTEKIAWSSIRNFNNALSIRSNADRMTVATADYAVILISGGLLQLGLYFYAVAEKASIESKNRLSVSIYRARYAYYYLFHDQCQRSIELLEESTSHFRSTGESWELMTAVGALGQNYFLISKFKESEQAYLEAESLARKLNSPMHIGWAWNKVPFIRYIRGISSAKESITMLREGIALSQSVNDHMTLCIHYGHLAWISVAENDPESAVEYADKTILENNQYTVNIPHIKLSLVNAAEAYVFALECGIYPEKHALLLSKARKALQRAEKIARMYRMLSGPASRARARLELYTGNVEKARQACTKSLEILANSPYAWEYSCALKLASRCIPEDAPLFDEERSLLLEQLGAVH